MKDKAYTQVTSRDTAVNTLRSWLSAANIPIQNSKMPGADITVHCMDGSKLELTVTLGRYREVPEGALAVRGEEIRCARLSQTHLANQSRSPRQIAFDAFHVITERAGYGRPLPFDRGEEPSRMFSFEEDGFLVPLRHNEFRRAPNPSPDKFEQYDDVLRRGAYLFYWSNKGLCERHVTSLEDVQNYANFLLVGFCAHHERANPINDENERLLTAYLKQRFAELRKSWMTQFLKVCPEEGEFALLSTDMPLHSREHSFREAYDWKETNDDEAFLNFQAEELAATTDLADLTLDNTYSLSTEADEQEQREQAKKRLSHALSSLPHSQMVESLQSIAASGDWDEETRKMAGRQLLLHSRRCEECSARRAHKEEVLPGVDARSSEK